MKEKCLKSISWILGRRNNTGEIAQENRLENSNASVRRSQLSNMFAIIMVLGFVIGGLALLLKERTTIRKQDTTQEVLTVELPDQALDAEKHWRNYFEENQKKAIEEMHAKLKEIAEEQAKVLKEANDKIEEELFETKEKLTMAQRELASASLELKRVAREETNQVVSGGRFAGVDLEVRDQDGEVEMDTPKSAENYIAEGTYFTGHLLGGIAVSTALNTASDNATPIAIRLINRFDQNNHLTTNLPELNKLDLSRCRVMGSGYGDLSSERAIVRLEKMVCEQDGVYVTSKIAGQIFGPDGLNGIKGDVVDTSSKHLKNVALGGMISGLSSVVKGQDASAITGSGLIYTPKKGGKTLLGDGAMQGASNVGEKLADYYLRQAEAMSPVLTVASGSRVNVQITKGFFVGELSTHKKIKAARASSSINNQSEYVEQ